MARGLCRRAFRRTSETSVRMSNASCSGVGQMILGACAVGFLTMPNSPTSNCVKPFCSLSSEFVTRRLTARIGAFIRKGFVDQLGPIGSEARQLPDALGHAFHRLKHRMEIVFLNQLRAAVFQDFGVYVALL